MMHPFREKVNSFPHVFFYCELLRFIAQSRMPIANTNSGSPVGDFMSVRGRPDSRLGYRLVQ